jgi:WS/DGAT/MGAT family acyltransferase
VESNTAHMHVGWVATFDPPEEGPPPSFEELRDHIARRLCRAPRYRQKLEPVPLGLSEPLWVDDESFDIANHVRRLDAPDLGTAAEQVMSVPLRRDRPLWEIHIADRLEDEGIGMVGKAHHCLVDGIAAVELAALLLDPTPESPALPEDGWRPAPSPGALQRLGGGALDLARDQVGLLREPVRLVRSPGRVAGWAREARRAASALGDALRPSPPAPVLNEPISPRRRLEPLARPLDDLRTIRRRFGTTLNDVLLATTAGGMRRFLENRGQLPVPLKAMVPVNLRTQGEQADMGNRISFIFVDLPCDLEDPAERLLAVHHATRSRKQAGEPDGADAILRAVGHAPRPLQQAVAHLTASSRAFNLVVSNIPGPREPLYMRGCRLREAFPVVPLADRHALSVGMTSICGEACFGLYADSESLPDVDVLAEEIDEEIDALLALSR